FILVRHEPRTPGLRPAFSRRSPPERPAAARSRALTLPPHSGIFGRRGQPRRVEAYRSRAAWSGCRESETSMAKERLIIFDTTRRDGEQSRGASMTKDEKIRIGRQLERMKVDVIEAGFPAASDGDFEAVQAVARTVKYSTISGLAHANARNIRRCGEAVKVAARPRVHTFIATSPIHME